MPELKLNKFQEDSLREICGIGAGHAATALSQMMGARINMSVPRVEIVPISQMGSVLPDTEEMAVGIYLRILGDVPGSLLLTLPYKDAISLAKYLVPERGEMGHSTLTEMDQSTLKEVGNIIAGSFLTVMSSVTRKPMIISVPRLACDMAGAIVDFILIELAQTVEEALIFEIELSDTPQSLSIKFLIFPNPGSMDVLFKAIGVQQMGPDGGRA